MLTRPTNLDVSWLLTVNERLLAGAEAYRDIIELNPPASILLYRLPVLAANLLGIRSEYVLAGMLALAIGGVLAWVARIMARYKLSESADNRAFLIVCGLVLSVLPFDEMAQREHFAAIFMLPYAAVAIARVSGRSVAPADGLIAGAMLGLCIAIKPHFALCALLVCGLEIWRSRNARALFRIEHCAAVAVALAYLVVSLVFYPKFFSDILPVVADLYLPLRLGLIELLSRAAVLLVLPVAICWMCRRRQENAGAMVLLLIGAGFLGAYLIQGKGWNYHLYPAVAFFLMAAAWATQQQRDGAIGPSRALCLLLLAIALALPAPRFLGSRVSRPALTAAVARLAPHPKILVIGFSQNVGHPLVRDVGGVWVGRSWGLWATGGAALMKARLGDDPVLRAKADAYFESDRLMLTQDIETQRPDLVLLQETVGFDFQQWIAEAPRLRAAMAGYGLVETVDGVEIFERLDLPE